MDDKVQILYDALRTIAGYGDERGICPYGCDTPYIAQDALKKFAPGLIWNFRSYDTRA